MPKIGRPSNSANKPRFTVVLLSQLTDILQPNAKVPVTIEFAKANFLIGENEEGSEENATEETPIAATWHQGEDE